MPALDGDQGKVLTQLATTVWGAFGNNGLNGDVKRHSQEIGELYGRDEALRRDLDNGLASVKDHVNAKFDSLYKLVATLIVSILVGAGGIIATLVVTGR